MNSQIRSLLEEIGIPVEKIDNNFIISRDILLDSSKYNAIKNQIPELKQYISSSFLTSLHESACLKQKWPLLNLVRQILKVHFIKLEPIRKSDGYDSNGKKRYKRFFKLVFIKKEPVDLK